MNGIQCPICQKFGFTQQNINLHTSYCLDQMTKKNNASGFVHHQSNNQTKLTTKPFKKPINNNRGQGNGLPKGMAQQGKISWDRSVIDVDLTSDNDDDDNDDDFMDGHHPMKKKSTGEHVSLSSKSSSSSSSSSSSFFVTGKENRFHQEQPPPRSIIDLVNNTDSLGTNVDCNQHQRQPGRIVNGLARMGPVHPSNTHQPTTLLLPTTHQQPVVLDVPLTLQQNIEQMALRAMVITNPPSFLSFVIIT